MGIPSGPFYVDDLLTWTSNTHTVTTGAATDADSVPTYRIYEDETGTAIATGSMAKLDDANTLGFYSEQLTLSAANGYEVGKSYSIYISSTVNSVTATKSENFKVIATPVAAPTAAVVADAVWDEASSGHLTPGSTGAYLSNSNATAVALDTALELDGAVYRYTANALEQAPAGGGGSAADVWNEPTAGHVTAGTFGKLVADINAKTTNLPPDPADASDIASSFAAIELAVDNVDEIADAVWTTAIRTLTSNVNLDIMDTDAVAAAVWDADPVDHFATDTFGEQWGIIRNNVADMDVIVAKLDPMLEVDGAGPEYRYTANALAEAGGGGSSLTAAAIATEVYDQANGVETGLTLRQAMRLAASALFGEASGLGTTTAIYRDFGDSKDRIVATVDDVGNRTAVTRDAT